MFKKIRNRLAALCTCTALVVASPVGMSGCLQELDSLVTDLDSVLTSEMNSAFDNGMSYDDGLWDDGGSDWDAGDDWSYEPGTQGGQTETAFFYYSTGY